MRRPCPPRARGVQPRPTCAHSVGARVGSSRRQYQRAERREVPYYNLPRLIFFSVRSLLDPQIDPARRPAALARVRRYAGLEPGTTSIIQLAERETREGLAKPGLSAPSRLEVENDLHTG